jgi:glycosyltransferase involved in cell wall biosynthesis
VPTPSEDWRKAKVDVVIPALNEQTNIALCLSSLAGQTLKPNRIMLVDDGSTDNTVDYVRAFGTANGMEITIIQRKAPIGKTPTLKRQARELDSDVEFILDGDTILESPNYIERVVEELYKAVGIACACGNVLSLRPRDRRMIAETPPMKKFLREKPDAAIFVKTNIFRKFQMAVTSLYRECLYTFLQRFVYRGQMTFFGSISHPVGCAVGYRRQYVKDLFDHYEPILGDDLTNSEDIFIGFALVNYGYRNIQLSDVFCRSQEPGIKKLPRQFLFPQPYRHPVQDVQTLAA